MSYFLTWRLNAVNFSLITALVVFSILWHFKFSFWSVQNVLGARDAAQWWNACLARVKPGVGSLVPQKHNEAKLQFLWPMEYWEILISFPNIQEFLHIVLIQISNFIVVTDHTLCDFNHLKCTEISFTSYDVVYFVNFCTVLEKMCILMPLCGVFYESQLNKNWLTILFKFSISPLIFYVYQLLIVIKRKSPNTTVDLCIYPYSSISSYIMHFEAFNGYTNVWDCSDLTII